jgi:hypothetical protein
VSHVVIQHGGDPSAVPGHHLGDGLPPLLLVHALIGVEFKVGHHGGQPLATVMDLLVAGPAHSLIGAGVTDDPAPSTRDTYAGQSHNATTPHTHSVSISNRQPYRDMKHPLHT